MSPRFDKLSQVPVDIQNLVRSELDRIGSDMTTLAMSGFAFLVVGLGEGRAIRLEDLSLLTKPQLADAEKSTSSRYIISPIHGKSRHNKHDIAHGSGHRTKDQITGTRQSR